MKQNKIQNSFHCGPKHCFALFSYSTCPETRIHATEKCWDMLMRPKGVRMSNTRSGFGVCCLAEARMTGAEHLQGRQRAVHSFIGTLMRDNACFNVNRYVQHPSMRVQSLSANGSRGDDAESFYERKNTPALNHPKVRCRLSPEASRRGSNPNEGLYHGLFMHKSFLACPEDLLPALNTSEMRVSVSKDLRARP